MVRFGPAAFNVALANAFRSYTIIHRFSNHRGGTRYDTQTIPRRRRTVEEVRAELGDTYFHRAYRMSYTDFQHFFFLLQPDLVRVMTRSARTNAPNGVIPLKSCLAIAIRYFSGGCPYDISVVYGVSHSVVLESVDYVIDAVNSSTSEWFKLEYPDDHDDQNDIAQGFKARSTAGFGNCPGCIDGMLVWIHKPSDAECEKTGVDSAKYFCGRKHKYGLNLQAICDVNRKFLDISIKWGGSASDLVAFETSTLCIQA